MHWLEDVNSGVEHNRMRGYYRVFLSLIVAVFMKTVGKLMRVRLESLDPPNVEDVHESTGSDPQVVFKDGDPSLSDMVAFGRVIPQRSCTGTAKQGCDVAFITAGRKKLTEASEKPFTAVGSSNDCGDY